MVLASTQSYMPSNELARLAIKKLIIEVAIPQVANVSVRLSFSELESLPAEIISLKQQIISLLAMPVCHACLPYHCHPISPPPPCQSSDEICWDHIR